MAIITKLTTDQGDVRPVYIRLNSFDQVANHAVPAIARFRAFASRDAFEAGASFLWERLVSFTANHQDAAPSLWTQAYTALQTTDFASETRMRCAELEGQIFQIEAQLAALPEPEATEPMANAAAQARADADAEVRHAARQSFVEQLERLEEQRPVLAAELARHRETAAAIAASAPA